MPGDPKGNSGGGMDFKYSRAFVWSFLNLSADVILPSSL